MASLPRSFPTATSFPGTKTADQVMTEAALAVDELIEVAVITLGAVGGTADAITATTGWANLAYRAGQQWRFVAASDNTGPATIAIDGLAARAIKDADGANLAAGDIVADRVHTLWDDGTNLRLIRDLPNALATARETAILKYRVAKNTNGGAATAGARTRYPLNVAVLDTITGGSFNAGLNQYSFPAGTYRFRGEVELLAVGRGYIGLRDSAGVVQTDSEGPTIFSNSGAFYATAKAHCMALLTFGAATTIELFYDVEFGGVAQNLGYGWNFATSLANQTYGTLIAERVA